MKKRGKFGKKKKAEKMIDAAKLFTAASARDKVLKVTCTTAHIKEREKESG